MKEYEIITEQEGRSTFLTKSTTVKGALYNLLKRSSDWNLVINKENRKMITIKIKRTDVGIKDTHKK